MAEDGKPHHGQFRGTRNLRRLADISDRKQREAVERGLELGLEAAPSVNDRTISTFARGQQPAFAGINTFRKAPYLEDVHEVGKHEVAILGAPFDMGTTYRAGCRFGPQAIRRISALYDSYSVDMAVDLEEELDLVDLGDVFVIPSNIEKSFDQIDRAVSWVVGEGVFPVVLGGDHSIGYPDVRAIAPHVDGRVGIIHLDRHLDIQERDMDERMHTTPWFHATNIENAPPANLVQMGIGGWYGSRPGVKVARDRSHDHRHRGGRRRAGCGGRPRGRLEGRGRSLPLVRHRQRRRRVRARHGLARARRPSSARSAQALAADRP
jgi:agmatinase